MPLIESIRVTGTNPEQLVARVRVDRTELIMHGDIFPHFGGKQFLALGTMRLIDGPDGEWTSKHQLPWPSDTRLVEVVVRPIDAKERGWRHYTSTRGQKRHRTNGALPHEPYSDLSREPFGDKAAE